MKFVRTANTGVKQRFGKYVGLCQPGLNLYIPFVETISSVSNRVYNHDIVVRVKTKDDVFTDLHIQVQLQIKPEDTETAFFKLQDPTVQVDSYVQNVVRSKAPTMALDQIFASQHDIAEEVSTSLTSKMSTYGYTIIDTLVKDIIPDAKVAAAMNEINASKRLMEAAKNKADAHYIETVRQAEADRDRKILQGEGISGQRRAILKGYENGVEQLSQNLGIEPKEVINFITKMQHLDTIGEIGRSQNTKTIFLSHQPNASSSDFTNSMMYASEKD